MKLLKVHLFGASEKSVSKSSKLMQSKWLSTFFVNLHQIRFVDFNICYDYDCSASLQRSWWIRNDVVCHALSHLNIIIGVNRWYIVKDCTDLWPVTNMTLPQLNCLDSIVLLVALKQWFLYCMDNSHLSLMFFMKDQLHEMFLSVSATQHHCHDVVYSDVLTVQSERILLPSST